MSSAVQAKSKEPDMMSAHKTFCRTYCKRVFLGFTLSVCMLLLGFILIIVGGVQSYTAIIILGVVFLIGSVVFVITICLTKQSIRQRLKGFLCCCEDPEITDSVQNRYAAGQTEDNQSATDTQDAPPQKQTRNHDPAEDVALHWKAIMLEPGESSTDDNGAAGTERIELKKARN